MSHFFFGRISFVFLLFKFFKQKSFPLQRFWKQIRITLKNIWCKVPFHLLFGYWQWCGKWSKCSGKISNFVSLIFFFRRKGNGKFADNSNLVVGTPRQCGGSGYATECSCICLYKTIRVYNTYYVLWVLDFAGNCFANSTKRPILSK